MSQPSPFIDLSSLNVEDVEKTETQIGTTMYVLVTWPHDQKYMEQPWFEEDAVPAFGATDGHFIPIKRLML